MRISDWSSDVCSSDLQCARDHVHVDREPVHPFGNAAGRLESIRRQDHRDEPIVGKDLVGPVEEALNRSEEHTSELQSLMRNSYAVFCLKKKTTTSVDTLTYM